MVAKIGLSIGDVAGIGPEIVIKAIASQSWSSSLQFFVYAPEGVIERLCEAHTLTLKNTMIVSAGSVSSDLISCGVSNALTGQFALDAIKRAVQDCMTGNLDALITAPVHKAAIRMIDPSFVGHTELLAQLS